MIHINQKGVDMGVFTLESVRNGLGTGMFSRGDWGWMPSMEKWRPLGELVDDLVAKDSGSAPKDLRASMHARLKAKIGQDGKIFVPKQAQQSDKQKTIFFGKLKF